MATGTIQKPLAADVDALNSKITLDMSYTSNEYVNATNFGRIHAYKYRNVLFCNFNCMLSAGLPSGANVTTIGKINNWNAASDIYTTVASQQGKGTAFAWITADGTLQIGNNCGTTIPSGDWIRNFFCVPSA